jgi:hypothetical protein
VAAEPSDTAPAPAPEPPPATPDETQVAADPGELTQLVRKFGAEQRRVPASLDELVAQGYLERVPDAPAGKRWVIDKRLQVYLTDK